MTEKNTVVQCTQADGGTYIGYGNKSAAKALGGTIFYDPPPPPAHRNYGPALAVDGISRSVFGVTKIEGYNISSLTTVQTEYLLQLNIVPTQL